VRDRDREVLERNQIAQRGGGVDIVVDDQDVGQGQLLAEKARAAFAAGAR
jgi:hypothetical protein